MPTLWDALNNPGDWPDKGGGGGIPVGGTPGTGGAPGGSYGGGGLPGGAFSGGRGMRGLSDILRQRRRRLMGLPGVGGGMTAAGGARGALMAGQGPVGPQGGPSLVPVESGAPAPASFPGAWGSGGRWENAMQPTKPKTDPFGRPQTYSPNDPYAPYTNDPRSDINGLINRLLGAGGNAGAFDPMGSSSVLRALEQKLGTDAAGRQAQAGTAARYFAGDDPAAAGFASLASVLGGQSQDAQTLNTARLDQMTRVQDWLRSILGGAPDYAQQLALARAQQQQQGSGIPGMIGTIGGGALGGLLGRPRPA